MSAPSITNPFVKISQADLVSGPILNEKLVKASRAGFFYLEMPDACKGLIEKAAEFANTLYTKKEYTELQLDIPSGFSTKTKGQCERLILEQKYWQTYLPQEIVTLNCKMYEIGIDILKKSLKACQVPEKDWGIASGNATEGKGMTFATFNHYNSSKQAEGLPAHRDFGQITVLFINQKGLQAKVNGEYLDVPNLDGHFIINFGRALETYINNPQQLTAAWHRVNQLAVDRISFGLFIDNKFDDPIYQRTADGNTIVEKTFGDYLKRLFAEAYDN
jgi:isopenicillin N synthase-like dioxygenase